MPLYRLGPKVGALTITIDGKKKLVRGDSIVEIPSHWAMGHVAAGNLVKAEYPMLQNNTTGVYDGKDKTVLDVKSHVRRMPKNEPRDRTSK